MTTMGVHSVGIGRTGDRQMAVRKFGETGGVLILGASGMLGHALMHELSAVAGDTPVVGAVRSISSLPETFRSRFSDRLVDGVDVLDEAFLSRLITSMRPQLVVNAVGVIKQAPGVGDSVLTTRINALLPHLLARDCLAVDARLVQVSTDCVFSGRDGGYTEDSAPDPVDFYGRSKLLGEVREPHLTLRTSIIGPELRHGGSLLEWFLAQDDREVRGFTKAIYSGLPTHELARVIATVVQPRPDLTGVWHVASEPIAKYELLSLIAEEYGWNGRIDPDDTFVCDRSLSATRLALATGYVAPPWQQMIAEMRQAHRRWSTIKA